MTVDEAKAKWQTLTVDEQIAALRRAEAAGVKLLPMMIPIFEAANAPPARSLNITDDTTDEELSAFIRGDRP